MPLQTRKFSAERKIALPRAQLWELLGNTDQLNRAIGLPVVHFDPVDAGDSALSREAQASILGFSLRWREYPFQWVRNREYSVLRVYRQSPVQRVFGGLRVADASTALPDGSPAACLHLFAEITPATLMGALLSPLIARDSFRKTFAYCEKQARMGHPGPARERTAAFPAMPSPTAPAHVNEAHLAGSLRELARCPVDQGYAIKLGAHLRERADTEVAGLRPYQIAREWGAVPGEVLRLCLYATKVGMLNLSWKMMCPNCRVSKAEYTSLAQLQEQFHCDLCGVDYTANFDRYIELRFAVHPGIRQAAEHTYCLGGPFLSPHVLVQQAVPQGQEAVLSYPAADQELRLRVLRANHIVSFTGPCRESSEAAPEHDSAGRPGPLFYRDEGWLREQAPQPATGAPLQIVNQSQRDVVLVLEKVEWDEDAVTAARVTTMPEFREMFSSEVLAPGRSVGIESLTLLFSDLRDSTSLYETIGDAPAYSRVRRHFDLMFRWIAHNSGSVVKTIGDAVMAVFYSPRDAVRAALDIQTHVDEFNATLEPHEAIVVKIGLHHGPAIAINSNEKLDYFGRTVNTAARIQGASQGKDVVMSGACYAGAGVPDVLEQYGATAGHFQANLKGIGGTLDLYRVQLGPTPAGPEL